MTLLIILLSILFIVLTIIVVSKTKTILDADVTSKEGEDSEYLGAPDKSNNANAIGLLVFWIISVIGIVWSYLIARKDFLPEASSVHGKETDFWFWFTMAILMIAFFLVNSVMFWFAYKYRFQKSRKASYYTHNNNLEIIWTSVPAVVMASLVFTGLRVWNESMMKAPVNAEKIEIMGKQFAWTVRYSGADNKFGRYSYKLMDDANGNPLGVDFSDVNTFDDFANASELHIPVNQPVKLEIRSRDVLHSVYIPHMRVKMDAVPGMPTSFYFTATKTTEDMRKELSNPKFNYEMACAEVCGRSHFGMKLLVVVDTKEDYAKWKASQKTLLAENGDLIKFVPANLKAKAMKYLAVAEEASTDSTATK